MNWDGINSSHGVDFHCKIQIHWNRTYHIGNCDWDDDDVNSDNENDNDKKYSLIEQMAVESFITPNSSLKWLSFRTYGKKINKKWQLARRKKLSSHSPFQLLCDDILHLLQNFSRICCCLTFSLFVSPNCAFSTENNTWRNDAGTMHVCICICVCAWVVTVRLHVYENVTNKFSEKRNHNSSFWTTKRNSLVSKIEITEYTHTEQMKWQKGKNTHKNVCVLCSVNYPSLASYMQFGCCSHN